MLAAISGANPKQPKPSQCMPLIKTKESKKLTTAKVESQKVIFSCFCLVSRYSFFLSFKSKANVMKRNGKAIATAGTMYFWKEYWKQDEGVKLYCLAKSKYPSHPRFSRKLFMDGTIARTASIQKIVARI